MVVVQWKERGALLSQDLLIVAKSNNMTRTSVDYYFFNVIEKYLNIKSDSSQREALH